MASPKLLKIISIITIFCLKSSAQDYLDYNSYLPSNSSRVSYQLRTKIDGESIVFRVINGVPAKLGDVPYLVGMFQRIGSGYYQAFCGGTIIGKAKVVTAAHCIARKKLSDCYKGTRSSSDFRDVRIVAGQLRTRTKYGLEGQWKKVKSGRYPKRYKFPKDDIAVLYLSSDYVFDSYVKPIPFASINIDYNLYCTISGYGRINARVQSDRLLTAELKVLSFKQCNKIHHRDFSKMVCTSDRTSDVHKGDSGGPLVCKGTGDPAEINKTGILVGVVSGRDMAKLMGSFFTRVSSYYKFIVSCSSKLEMSSYFLLFMIFYKLY